MHPEEAAPWVAAGWLQRPQVSAHQPAWAIQDWLHWPHSFFWAHVVPSAVGNGRKVGRRERGGWEEAHNLCRKAGSSSQVESMVGRQHIG